MPRCAACQLNRTGPSGSDSPETRGLSNCRRRNLWRQKTLAVPAQKGFPAEGRPRGASADFAHRAAFGRIEPAASHHERAADHQVRMAEGFARGCEISAALFSLTSKNDLRRLKQTTHGTYRACDATHPYENEQHLGRSSFINYESDQCFFHLFSALHDVSRYNICNWQEAH